MSIMCPNRDVWSRERAIVPSYQFIMPDIKHKINAMNGRIKNHDFKLTFPLKAFFNKYLILALIHDFQNRNFLFSDLLWENIR
ncbi:hypothetical protein BpHYR1_026165 [Brachionus plicatilis]|uniref:Uncharacterized protein n=1 Tax=Brachionus plicatilis TaxID=10195 RepID=A0A3M7T7A1_BRAPC|nr:hypothetical protein BpHYR1_026165 [Brachionus plicatilis]